MPFNPKLTSMVASYLDPVLVKRMEKVQKRMPRLSISKQVAAAVEAHLPTLEAKAGIKSAISS
jgi:hypothetical protein